MIVNAPNGLRGRVSAVLGPTNTGKTHLAVQTMLDHADGIIGLPLRLLAREVYDRIVAEKGVGNVALVTGEEKIVPAHAHYYVCTVEAMPTSRPFQFVAIDEIQLCADPERGHVFTDRLLHMRGTDTTVFMGSDTIGPLIRRIIPDAAMVTRPRLSRLSYTGPTKLSKLPRRSAIVTFSAADVYAIGELMRRQRGGAAVVLGALSPRTRNAQVAMYQAGEVDFLVATDAIGMGLNMDVRHVAFAGSRKFDGEKLRGLMPQEIGQIAGRAGRYTSDGTFGVTADVEAFDEDLVQQVEDHKFENLTHLRWRSARLDYKSPTALIASLEAKPPASYYMAPRIAQDLKTLKSLLREDDIADAAHQRDLLIQLWQVCQVPDFRKTMHESHVRLLAEAYRYLMKGGQLPDQWIERNISQLDRLDGEIDTLQTRLAHIRTWTYISHRSDWIGDAAAWQMRARNVEDRLSDALHEKLAQRFVDRRTAALVNRLRDRELVNASIDIEGRVSVEEQYVGRLQGLSFEVDPGALENKALKSAVNQVLADALVARSHKIAKAMDEMLRLENDGRVLWLTVPIATLVKGNHVLKPGIRLIASDQLPEKSAELITNRLLTWIEFNVNKHLKPLLGLEEAEMSPAARGVAFQLVENVGVMRRDRVAEQMRDLDPKDFGRFKYRGVTLGRFSIFSALVLKPEPTRWRAILAGLNAGEDFPVQEEIGRVSYPLTGDVDEAKLLLTGYRRFGDLAVRVDMVERMAAHAYRATKEGEAEADHELMSMLGGGPERLAPVLAGLGYVTERENEESPLKYKRKPRPQRNRGPKGQRGDRKAAGEGGKGRRPRGDKGRKGGGDKPPRTAQAAPPRKKGAEYDPDSPFAALAALKKA